MSDYQRIKVVRYPVTRGELAQIVKSDEDDLGYLLEKKFPDLVEYDVPGKFYWGTTYPRTFLDYCVEEEYGADAGEWGKIRELTQNEKRKYGELFRQILPIVNEDDLRVVEYCYYNCSEAPDYYNIEDDPFYKEV